MLADLNAGGTVLQSPFDVCISGSGPAGMSLALRLAAKSHRVLLLEAGGLQYSQESQDVYKGTNTGLDYFPGDTCRLRFLGGSSNHWAGWGHALDAADFVVREHVPHSGWPITREDLDPYLAETAELLDVQFPRTPDYLLLQDDDPNLRNIDFGHSIPVTRFGAKYRQTIEAAMNLVVVVNANVVDIELRENLKSVSSLRVANYVGDRFNASANCYVLCHGGIENPRTLLNANRQMTPGIGNGKDLVGRFFMEHPHLNVASALLNYENAGLASKLEAAKQTAFRIGSYEPKSEFRDRMKTLTFGIHCMPRRTTPNRGSLSFTARLKRFVCESDLLVPVVDSIGRNELVNCPSDMVINTSSEQAPNPSSRIRLGRDVDKFGNRRVEIDWRLTELDKHTLRQSALEVGRIMAQKNLGRVRLSEWLLEPDLSFPDTTQDEVGGNHHMGTTRMAESPDKGVVDKHHRVFGIDNLHIAGSSVFATVGHVNPTFTIVQLSLRLADHLHDRIRTGGLA